MLVCDITTSHTLERDGNFSTLYLQNCLTKFLCFRAPKSIKNSSVENEIHTITFYVSLKSSYSTYTYTFLCTFKPYLSVEMPNQIALITQSLKN